MGGRNNYQTPGNSIADGVSTKGTGARKVLWVGEVLLGAGVRKGEAEVVVGGRKVVVVVVWCE